MIQLISAAMCLVQQDVDSAAAMCSATIPTAMCSVAIPAAKCLVQQEVDSVNGCVSCGNRYPCGYCGYVFCG